MEQTVQPRSAEDCFDVVVIGGGVNGTASLRELSRAGYSTLLAEADDLASGASGRSSRMLHCGLRYFETANPVRDFVGNPQRFFSALSMARDAMEARRELALDDEVDTRAIELSFPAWTDGPFPRWQISAGLRLLGLIGPKDPPLDRHVRNAGETRNHPIGQHLREPDKLTGMVSFREYLFGAPERLCIDNALDAEAHGAELCLQTRAEILGKDTDGLWRIALESRKDGRGRVVRARSILNMAGTWSDAVGDFGKRLICGTKGAHIIIRLPDGFADRGIATLHRGGHPFYGLPLGDDRFYFGPTETLFEGDARDIQADNEDIEFLLGEARHLLPGLDLKRGDIEQCWAGVRPLTSDPRYPMGARARTIHDLGPQGFDNVLAMTGGPVMSHRSAGRLMLEQVRARIGAPRDATLSARKAEAPAKTRVDPVIEAVTREHAFDLNGVLSKRTGATWKSLVGHDAAMQTAQEIAPHLSWDATRTDNEVFQFLARQAKEFGVPATPE